MGWLERLLILTVAVIPACRCLNETSSAHFNLKDLGTTLEVVDRRKPPGRPKLDHLPIEVYMDDKLMREAFGVIDKYLSKSVKNNIDLDSNIAQAKSMIRTEMRFARAPILSPCGWCKKLSCLSPQLRTKDSQQMVNALLMIAQLERVNRPETECDAASTRILNDNNKWAGDPIGRRLQGRTDSMNHIDRLIFSAALRRAGDCVPRYRTDLKDKEELFGQAWMKVFWSRILDHRFKKANGESCEREIMAESIFRLPPAETIDFVKRMPDTLGPDEVAITVTMLENATVKSHKNLRGQKDKLIEKFDTLLVKPCNTYVDALRRTFESLDFDMRLKNLLPKRVVESIENYDLIVRQRAYFMLCQKLVLDKRRFKHELASVH